jgi:hypothetical protein
LTNNTVTNTCPVSKDLCERLTEFDIKNLSQILNECIQKGTLRKFDVERVASSIITVVYAIKNKKTDSQDINLSHTCNIQEVEQEVEFTVSLILEGLANKK